MQFSTFLRAAKVLSYYYSIINIRALVQQCNNTIKYSTIQYNTIQCNYTSKYNVTRSSHGSLPLVAHKKKFSNFCGLLLVGFIPNKSAQRHSIFPCPRLPLDHFPSDDDERPATRVVSACLFLAGLALKADIEQGWRNWCICWWWSWPGERGVAHVGVSVAPKERGIPVEESHPQAYLRRKLIQISGRILSSSTAIRVYYGRNKKRNKRCTTTTNIHQPNSNMCNLYSPKISGPRDQSPEQWKIHNDDQNQSEPPTAVLIYIFPEYK